jgi:hypothetical protein
MSRPSDPSWTDFNEGDPGITLVELFAFLAELLDYLQDAVAEQQRRRRLERYLLVAGAITAIVWCRRASDR